MAQRAKTIDLLRVVDVLQEHITSALCRTVFGAVRKTERQRVWTLEALIRFWTAVVLRAPKALSQALVDSLEGRDPTFPRIEASPEAFFQRCRDLRPAFFAEVFQRFTRSEEHTSELQSQSNIVCRLLLEKKKRRPCRRPAASATPKTVPT